jgi:two-component system, NtrC family, nitrogen regulation sensor histidine kinase NtrY
MLARAQKLLRLDRLERRLFGWLLVMTLVPVLTLLAAGYVLGARSLNWVGTLGPWDQVAESGRALVDAATAAAADDPALARALEEHREQLSSSVLLARRWAYLGDRLAAALPFVALGLAMLLGTIALGVGRRLSVQLARPIKDVAGWAETMAVGQPLPPPAPREAREVREVRALRDAMRLAAVRIADARSRDLEAERVRAWGEMARRVAHEMKNPLTPLRLAAHRLARHPDAQTSLREPLEVIEEETTRLDELARQFAVLGRPSSGPASDVDIGELLETLLRSDVPAHVAVRIDVAPDIPLLHAHYDALQRAFRNLVRNAVEAMGAESVAGAQVLDVTARMVRHPAGADDGGDGRAVRITIADTGCGFPADRAERLFEPDYSLKAGGTGLGLAVVRQAVAAHGGSVAARPRAGGGAEFVVELPAATPPRDAAAAGHRGAM